MYSPVPCNLNEYISHPPPTTIGHKAKDTNGIANVEKKLPPPSVKKKRKEKTTFLY
jgi:hypothetical protein